jgi:hypothetical protein
MPDRRRRSRVWAGAAVDRPLRITPWFIAAALATLLTGGALVFLAGGISRVPARILVGAALVVPVFVIGGAVVRPTLMKVHDHVRAGGSTSLARPLVRRFFFAHRVEQLLRLTALALMVLPF